MFASANNFLKKFIFKMVSRRQQKHKKITHYAKSMCGNKVFSLHTSIALSSAMMWSATLTFCKVTFQSDAPNPEYLVLVPVKILNDCAGLSGSEIEGKS